jgi:hypothetical protein
MNPANRPDRNETALGTPASPHAPGRTVLSVRIERMTLEGISRADADRVATGIRRKIADLAGATALPSRAPAALIESFDGGSIAGGSSPEQMGEHIAREIFKALTSR